MDNDKTKTDFLYCNQMQLSASPWDFLFTFQRVSPAFAMDGKMSVVEELQVAMSPAHAKIALAALYQVLEAYEVNSGIIPLDEENQAKYDIFVQKAKKLP